MNWEWAEGILEQGFIGKISKVADRSGAFDVLIHEEEVLS